jgi:hypothetical protein
MKAINFLIEVSLLQCILFLVYQFLFSNQTDFKWNRKFLLTTTLLTWLIPFLNIDLFFAQQAIITLPDNIKTYWLSDVDVSSAAEKTYLFNFEIILKFIYFSINLAFSAQALPGTHELLPDSPSYFFISGIRKCTKCNRKWHT